MEAPGPSRQSLEPNTAAWCEVRTAEFLAKGDLRDNQLDNEPASRHVIGSVLDVGCAFGSFSYYLSMEHSYIGVDISALAIAQARQAYPLRVFLIGNAMKMGAAWAKSVDTVVAFQFLEHFKNPRACLDNLRALARKRVIITVPRGEPTRDQVKNEGHRAGWPNEAAIRHNLAMRGTIRAAPFECDPAHIGTVFTW